MRTEQTIDLRSDRASEWLAAIPTPNLVGAALIVDLGGQDRRPSLERLVDELRRRFPDEVPDDWSDVDEVLGALPAEVLEQSGQFVAPIRQALAEVREVLDVVDGVLVDDMLRPRVDDDRDLLTNTQAERAALLDELDDEATS